MDQQPVAQFHEAHPDAVIVALRRRDGTVRVRPEPTHILSVGEVLIVSGRAEALTELQDSDRTSRAAA